MDMRERLQMFHDRVLAHDGEHPGYLELWEQFRHSCLEHGGIEIVPPMLADAQLERLCSEAVLFDGHAAVFHVMDTSRCHANVSSLWLRGEPEHDPVMMIGTGYALSKDGLWRQHSWGHTRNGSLVETTSPRDSMFGLVLQGTDSARFAIANNPELATAIATQYATLD
jgi:hypothetical protein